MEGCIIHEVLISPLAVSGMTYEVLISQFLPGRLDLRGFDLRKDNIYTIYIMYKGKANNRNEKFGFILNMVLGINSPAKRIRRVDIIDWIRTINAGTSTKVRIDGSNTKAICKP